MNEESPSRNEGSIELVALSLLAALVVVLAMPLFGAIEGEQVVEKTAVVAVE